MILVIVVFVHILKHIIPVFKWYCCILVHKIIAKIYKDIFGMELVDLLIQKVDELFRPFLIQWRINIFEKSVPAANVWSVVLFGANEDALILKWF